MSGEALFSAAGNGDLQAVRHLLHQGLRPDDHRDADRWTALHHASCTGHTDIVRELVECRADVKAKDLKDCTPLHLAAQYDHVQVVEHLLQAGSRLRDVNADGNTALHLACWYGHLSVVRLMVNSPGGLRVLRVRCAQGRTPVDWAEARGHRAVEDFLRETEQSLQPQQEQGMGTRYMNIFSTTSPFRIDFIPV